MRFAVRGTSRNRLWTGIEASLADTSMHVGAPVAATCPQEEALQHRPRAVPEQHAVKRRLRFVIEHIHEHLGENLALAELAAIAGISPTHLKNQFKRVTGMPIHQYIMHRRVEYAILQISTCDVALSALAQNAGFANQSHMARCMKKIAGVTPSVVRECPIVFEFVRM